MVGLDSIVAVYLARVAIIRVDSFCWYLKFLGSIMTKVILVGFG
jgi:hypothetical protein